MTIKFSVPAVRGIMGKKQYVVATMPMRTLVSLLRVDNQGSTLERSQREINPTRARSFANYLVNCHRKGLPFVIPTVTGVIHTPEGVEEAEFIAVSDDSVNVGSLSLSLDHRALLFDGQHRSSGIALALDEESGLGSELVSIKLFLDLTLEERQQFFAVINGTMVKPSSSITATYNHNDPLSALAHKAVNNCKMFKGDVVDYEKTTATGSFLYTFKGIVDAVKVLIGFKKGMTITEDHEKFVIKMFDTMSQNLGMDFFYSDKTIEEVRSQTLKSHGVVFKSLVKYARFMVNEGIAVDEIPFESMGNGIDWRKTGDLVGRCVDKIEHTMIVNSLAVDLSVNLFVKKSGRLLNEQQRELEIRHFPSYQAEYEAAITAKEEAEQAAIEAEQAERDKNLDKKFNYTSAKAKEDYTLMLHRLHLSDEQIEEALEKFTTVMSEYKERYSLESPEALTHDEARRLRKLAEWMEYAVTKDNERTKVVLNIRSLRANVRECING